MDFATELPMPNSTMTPATVLLAVVTLAAAGMLILNAVDRASVLAWAAVVLPLVVAAGTVHFAADARRRGDLKSATNMVALGLTANVVVSCIAALQP